MSESLEGHAFKNLKSESSYCSVLACECGWNREVFGKLPLKEKKRFHAMHIEAVIQEELEMADPSNRGATQDGY